MNIDNSKNFNYAEGLKTTSGNRSRQSGDFFMPSLWRTRTVNISNSGQPLVGFSESATYSVLGGNLKQRVEKMKKLISYTFKNTQIRTQAINGEPWFCLIDCCKALGIKNAATSVKLSEAGVGKTYCSYDSGKKEIIIINEPNLYRLIFRSNKPQAQAFADWVYSEVLPSIRKTGTYTTASSSSLPGATPSLSCSGSTGASTTASTLRQELAALASDTATDADMQDMRNLIAALMNNIIDGRVKNQYRHLVDEIAALRTKLDTIRKTIA